MNYKHRAVVLLTWVYNSNMNTSGNSTLKYTGIAMEISFPTSWSLFHDMKTEHILEDTEGRTMSSK